MAVTKMTPASWVKLLDGEAGEFADEATPGLRLKVGARGAVWNLHLRDLAGRMRKIGLGGAGANGAGLDLVKARAAAAATRSAVQDGRDPTAEKRQTKASARIVAIKASAGTLRQLLDLYGERDGARLRTWERQRSAIGITFATLLDVPASQLDKPSLRDAYETHVRTAPTAATRNRAYLASVLNWAVGRDMLDANPLASVKPPKGAGLAKRDRVLSDAEIGKIMVALPTIAKHRNLHDHAFRVLFWTGCRLGEIAGMRWGELEPDLKLWRLPAARAKNGREHHLPLPSQMTAMLAIRRDGLRTAAAAGIRKLGREPTADELAAVPAAGDLVLPGGRGGQLTNWDRVSKELMAASGTAGWHRHDIRRSVVTGMVELGVSPHVVEAIVNHVSGSRGGVAGVYNKAKLLGPMRDALQLWADHLDRIGK